MKKSVLLLAGMVLAISCRGQQKTALWVEAESFDTKGGWVVDQQSMDVMGSPYLMAHGMGEPVADAGTAVEFPQKGNYQVFVRTRNWTAPWSDVAAGRFRVKVNGKALDQILGNGSAKWNWVHAGEIRLKDTRATISLHDLSGFNGRCDALYFTMDPSDLPPNIPEDMDLRKDELREKLPEVPEMEFDFVVVGGGVSGTCAAISAARLGVKTALIQNRPVLGGNNSSEVRVHLGARINQEPYPALGNLVNEIGPVRGGNARPGDYYEDEKKLQAVLSEPNLSLFLNTHANGVIMDGNRIVKVLAENIETGQRTSFSAPLFADCSGDGSIGYLAGAEYMSGREGRDVFNESRAPEQTDSLTMGISVQWFSEAEDEPAPFPDIRWGLPWNEEKSIAIRRGDWDWETGMGKDMINETEHIRDYGMLVVYSNWSFLKNHHSKKEEFANEKLRWVAYVGGKRESRRLAGDLILTENDLTQHRVYPDGTAPTTWTIDLHYPHEKNAAMFTDPFRSVARHTLIHPYPIPFRCLYSRNVENLMMAGRNISVSHVALGTIRLMRTGGMMGEVLGMAASVCKEQGTDPRGVYEHHFAELEKLMLTGVGDPSLPFTQDYNMGGTLGEQDP